MVFVEFIDRENRTIACPTAQDSSLITEDEETNFNKQTGPIINHEVTDNTVIIVKDYIAYNGGELR